MSRRRVRRRRGGPRWRARTLFAAAVAAFAVAGLRCAPEGWLEDLAGPLSPRPGGEAPAQGPAPPSPHVALGVPAPMRAPPGGIAPLGPDDDRLTLKPHYALSYNRSRNGPNWVGWQLDASWFGPAPRFRGKFIADDTLPAGFYRVTHDDYTGSGFDRGHMVRSEERTRTPEDNKATFLLTNILPQTHELNAGPWLRLEEHCQRLAQQEGRSLYLVAGGLHGPSPRTIGKGVAVPDAFFKIVVVLGPGQGAADVGPSTRVVAVVMPNEAGLLSEGWGRYRTSVNEIERRAGFDFLTAVPEAVQRVVEARVDDGPTGDR